MNRDLDEQKTTPDEARKIMLNLRDNGFDGSDGELGLALGLTTEETHKILNGELEISNDLLMKIRGIAEERNISIE